LFGDAVEKSLRLHLLKSDRDEIWQKCSLIKETLIDSVGFPVQDGGHDVISHRKLQRSPGAQ